MYLFGCLFSYHLGFKKDLLNNRKDEYLRLTQTRNWKFIPMLMEIQGWPQNIPDIDDDKSDHLACTSELLFLIDVPDKSS